MRELTAVYWRLLPCIQFQRLQSQEPWLSSAQFPSGYEAVLGWVLCHLESRVPQAMRKNPSLKYLKMWRPFRSLYRKQLIQLNTGIRQWWSLLTTDLPTFGRISRLQKQISDAKKPRDLIKKILTQHVVISTRNCMMELRTGNWIGVTVTHPKTFANGGSINIFYMTEIQHLLSVHHILFLSILVPLSWPYFFLISLT